MATKGLVGFMQNMVAIGEFQGFHINEEVHFKIFQFADGIVLIADDYWNNLWRIKVSLKILSWCQGCKRTCLKENFMVII